MPERSPRLEGKVAIVTGAGSSGPGVGNGRATATLFAREGAKVLLADITEERAAETMEMIQAEGGVASTVQADVTRATDCERMVDTCIERYGRLDILDNNVGISRRGTVVEVSEEDWDHIMAVNVKTIVMASKFAIPRMIEAGGGSIINISSIAGLRAHSSTPYTASKAAVIGLTISMAADHGARRHTHQLHRAGAGVHADGGAAHGRRPASGSQLFGPPAHRGHRLGHRQRRPVPGQRRGPLDQRGGAAGGRRAGGDVAGHLPGAGAAGAAVVW